MYIYIYIHTYNTYIYIYIHRERERESERDLYKCMYMYMRIVSNHMIRLLRACAIASLATAVGAWGSLRAADLSGAANP